MVPPPFGMVIFLECRMPCSSSAPIYPRGLSQKQKEDGALRPCDPLWSLWSLRSAWFVQTCCCRWLLRKSTKENWIPPTEIAGIKRTHCSIFLAKWANWCGAWKGTRKVRNLSIILFRAWKEDKCLTTPNGKKHWSHTNTMWSTLKKVNRGTNLPTWPQEEPHTDRRDPINSFSKEKAKWAIWCSARKNLPTWLEKKPPHRNTHQKLLTNTWKHSLSALVLPERFLGSLSFEVALASCVRDWVGHSARLTPASGRARAVTPTSCSIRKWRWDPWWWGTGWRV